eukprot:CAMPEP_0117061032 /NCGR_PEP_ID=MMETSP0472-20121206/42457_1 /TAXON_ID=693140 ORGANISM="Tiarina fusus, Strain LIS" /NCGR_SAMPLE_ID=MMETSP0472 /ASSEMBLY_ACC=CAM_ASM_000603 /LENGTH=164 /DNA_ID=CAMNT_0004779485 /DNA_START=260 /DNA_END=754 /DNA_ORIENTATION=-
MVLKLTTNFAKNCRQEIDVAKFSYTLEKDFTLKDGKEFSMSIERFQCAEILFQPNLIGESSRGIHELVCESVARIENNLQKQMYGNIVVSGGTSLLPGFVERLKDGILAHTNEIVKIIAPKNRNISAWYGASKLCTGASFEECWVSKEEYDEYGPTIVHKKCPY